MPQRHRTESWTWGGCHHAEADGGPALTPALAQGRPGLPCLASDSCPPVWRQTLALTQCFAPGTPPTPAVGGRGHGSSTVASLPPSLAWTCWSPPFSDLPPGSGAPPGLCLLPLLVTPSRARASHPSPTPVHAWFLHRSDPARSTNGPSSSCSPGRKSPPNWVRRASTHPEILQPHHLGWCSSPVSLVVPWLPQQCYESEQNSPLDAFSHIFLILGAGYLPKHNFLEVIPL